MLAEPSKGGTEEQKEGEIAPDKETVKVHESSQKKTKGKQSLAKPKGKLSVTKPMVARVVCSRGLHHL